MVPADSLPSYTIRQLAAFVAVAETGTISGAAERMHQSQSALAAAVTDLEKALGARLTVRKRARGVQLTPTGEAVLGRARTLLGHTARLQADVENGVVERAAVAEQSGPEGNGGGGGGENGGADGGGGGGVPSAEDERARMRSALATGVAAAAEAGTESGQQARQEFLTRLAVLLGERVGAAEFDRCVRAAMPAAGT